MNKLQNTDNERSAVDTVLGGAITEDKEGKPIVNDKRYELSKDIATVEEEIVHVKNPITGKETDITLSRKGTTDEKLAMVLLSPDATKEQKDTFLAQALFERGKESASFLAELFVSKGTHLKETQAFKRNMRFDFEMFADKIVNIFKDISIGLRKDLNQPNLALNNLADRLFSAAELITKQREAITEARMRDKGFGIYTDRAGRAFSIHDKDIEEAITNDKKEVQNEKEGNKQASNEEGSR